MVIRGAVAAGLLEKGTLFLVIVTMTGTSVDPANDAGKVNSMKSHPGISVFGRTRRIAVPVISVVPMVTLVSAGVAPRTPVKLT